MRTFTRVDVMAFDGVMEYYREKVEALLSGLPERMTAIDVLARDLSVEDRFGVVLREEAIPAGTLRFFAVACARRALEREREQEPFRQLNGKPDLRYVPGPKSWAALNVAKQYAQGKVSDDALACAFSQAWGAIPMGIGSNSNALTSAWATTCPSARDAAMGASHQAILAAREHWPDLRVQRTSVDRNKDGALEGTWQVECLRAMLTKEAP